MDSRKRDHLMEQLSAYLDDELTPAQQREVEAFLAEDAEARTVLAELRATAQTLHELPRARASERLLEGIRTRMEREALLGQLQATTPVPRERSLGLRWMAAAAVIGLTAGTLYLIGPMSRRETPVITVASAERKSDNQKAAPTGSADRVQPGSMSRRQAAVKSQDVRELPAAQAAPVVPKTDQPEGSGTLGFFARQPGADHDGRPPELKVQVAEEGEQLRAYAAPKTEDKSASELARIPSGVRNERDIESVRPAREASPSPEIPVFAFVELSAPDSASQRKTAETLRSRFDFNDADDVLTVAAGSEMQAVSVGSPVRPEKLAPSAAGGSIDSITQATAPAEVLALKDQVAPAAGADQIVLRRVVSEESVSAALQEVHAEWPGARVERVSAGHERASVRSRGSKTSPPGDAVVPSSLQEEYKDTVKYYFGQSLDLAASAPQRSQEGRQSIDPVSTQPAGGSIAGEARVPSAPQIADADASDAAASVSLNRAVVMTTAPADRFAGRGLFFSEVSSSRPTEVQSTSHVDSFATGEHLGAFGRLGVPPSTQPAAAGSPKPADGRGVILLYLSVAGPTTRPGHEARPAVLAPQTGPAAVPPASQPGS